MLFEAYKNWIVYSGQDSFTFPKTNPNTKKPGFGNAVFLLTPNLNKSEELLNDSKIKLYGSFYKKYILPSIYREKIGTTNIIRNRTSEFNKIYKDKNLGQLNYVARGNIKSIINSNRNIVVDLSEWLNLFFAYRKSINTRQICETFISFLSSKLNDVTYNGYNKVILLDLKSWNNNASDCVIMSKKLLNNPLSILIYSLYHYPELISTYLTNNIKLYLINRNSSQLLLLDTNDLRKDNYTRIKARLKQFKGIEFSVEEETNKNISDNEIKANIIEDFKSSVVNTLKGKLVGTSNNNEEEDNDEDNSYDITTMFDDDTDDNIEVEDEDTNNEEDDDEYNIDPELLAELDKMIEENPDISINSDAISVANDILEKRKKDVYVAPFAPVRSPEQLDRINALLEEQNAIIKPMNDKELIESQKIDTTDYSNILDTTNTNILKSQFVNFDKNYVEKKYMKDIDNAVACLSNANEKVFITNKEVIDSSDTMNLKNTMVYSLKDEKGNRMTLRFDIPIIIDNNYIFINGSKKVIGHQFVLKPLVKTAPDTVQMVTFYNKAFITRDGMIDANTNSVKVYMKKHLTDFKVQVGNTSMKNSKYLTSLDFNMFCKEYYQFKIGDYLFITEIDKLIEKFKKENPNKKVSISGNKYPCAYNTKTKELVYLKSTDSFTEFIMNILPENAVGEIKKIKRKPKLIYVRAKIMGKYVPLIIDLLYWEGFNSVMHKANIDYNFIDKKSFKKIDKFIYDFIELADGIVYWKKSPMKNSLLMNGLHKVDFSIYTFEELESKDTYRNIMMQFYDSDDKTYALDQHKDFMIDDVTKEILIDMNYPTDLVSLFILAVTMLCDNSYKPENDMTNMRIRSNEVIPNIVYKTVAEAYNKYRRTSYKTKPSQITVKQSAIIDMLLSDKTNLLEESSVLNPILEIEKARSVTFKGLRGIQLDRAMTLQRRGYNESMLGVVGISTPSDSNCGIVRQLTLEPNITSTRGYIDVKNKEGLDEMGEANLLTPAELLTPLGAIHDDPDRTAMSWKQTKYMVSVADPSPVLFGNKVETLLPYLISDEFIVDAKDNGQVIAIENDYVIIQYNNGTKYAIDIAERIKKNSQAGFFIENTLTCNLKVGDKFKKGDILAYAPETFSSHKQDKGASMNLGAFAKIAIMPQYDIFEDSVPISKSLSERVATVMIKEEVKVFEPNTYVEKIVKIGQKIQTGEPLMVFSQSDDPEFAAILANIRADQREVLAESVKNTIDSHYTGEVADIKVYTTVPIEELDPTLAKIVKDYHNRIGKRNKTLSKYANSTDGNFYKAGQIIEESDEVMKPSRNGKIKGEYADGKVVICFYVKYVDEAAKGDKLCCQFALKGVCSHVIEEGLEPYSEYRPDEIIDTVVSPLAVSARKVPSIFLAMFTNKLIVEAKNQLRDIYFENEK